MSHPLPPPSPTPTSSNAQTSARVVHNVALAAVIVAPALALLPPRKLDLYTLGLVGTAAYSGNYLLKESTGRSVWEHFGTRTANPTLGTAATIAAASGTRHSGGDNDDHHHHHDVSAIAGIQQELRGPRETWKAQRRREIQEDVEEGKGFGDMIMDQIWEVWNWGKTGDGEE